MRLFLTIAIGLLLTACYIGLPSVGGEGQDCFDNGSCDDGLTCVANTCIPNSAIDGDSDLDFSEIEMETEPERDIEAEWEPQSDTPCTNGYTRDSNTSCGLNNRGVLLQECVDEVWVDTDQCIDRDECVDDTERPNSEGLTCGLNRRGHLGEICIDGIWHDSETCYDPDVCTDENLRIGDTPCGDSGVFRQECRSGQWVDTAVCIES